MPLTLSLQDVLGLAGRLDDAGGFDAPRERFRRFIIERISTPAEVARLLEECQHGLGDQHARARQDLVVRLGRFLGFDITFGRYEPGADGVRREGTWRSPEGVRLALEVRSERTTSVDVAELARTLAHASGDAGDRWVGLVVLTPFYVLRAPLEELLARREPRDVRSVSVESLVWLADRLADGRVTHGDVLRLLTSGPDSDFMIDLMRRLTEGDARAAQAAPTLTSAASTARPTFEPAHDTPGPKPDVRRADAGEPAVGAGAPEARSQEFWVATLASDEGSTPEQLLDSVIRRRQVLGVSDDGPFVTDARAGDRVCFLIAGSGVVGHAELDSVIADASTVIRAAQRFTAVFRLRHLRLFEVPVPVPAGSALERIAERMPFNARGAILSRIARPEFEAVTTTGWGGAHAVGA